MHSLHHHKGRILNGNQNILKRFLFTCDVILFNLPSHQRTHNRIHKLAYVVLREQCKKNMVMKWVRAATIFRYALFLLLDVLRRGTANLFLRYSRFKLRCKDKEPSKWNGCQQSMADNAIATHLIYDKYAKNVSSGLNNWTMRLFWWQRCKWIIWALHFAMCTITFNAASTMIE